MTLSTNKAQFTVKLEDGKIARVLTPTLTNHSVQISFFNNETGRYETQEIYSDNPIYKSIVGENNTYQYYQNRIDSEQELLDKYQKQAKIYGKQASIFGQLAKESRNTAYNLMRENNIQNITQLDEVQDAEIRNEIEQNYTNASVYRTKKTSASNREFSFLIDAFLQVFHIGKAKQEQQLFA